MLTEVHLASHLLGGFAPGEEPVQLLVESLFDFDRLQHGSSHDDSHLLCDFHQLDRILGREGVREASGDPAWPELHFSFQFAAPVGRIVVVFPLLAHARKDVEVELAKGGELDRTRPDERHEVLRRELTLEIVGPAMIESAVRGSGSCR